MKHQTEAHTHHLEAPTILNRALTGGYVATGRLPLFKKRLVRFRDAFELSLVGVVPALIAILVFIIGYVFDMIDGERTITGVLTFSSIIFFTVAHSYGSLRYHIGGVGSETD